MNADNTVVSEVWPSYYWPMAAVVIVTTCGHRHVRPITMTPDIGSAFLCPFCGDATASVNARLCGHGINPVGSNPRL